MRQVVKDDTRHGFEEPRLREIVPAIEQLA
jgi:hypothetical protein